MKNIMLAIVLMLAFLLPGRLMADVPDSVYIYLYTDMTHGGHDGLHWAWSTDGKRWISPAPWQKLVTSDYGAWGAEKRMFSPAAVRDAAGTWHVLWSVNGHAPTFAHAASDNLIDWLPQSYPAVSLAGHNCVDPEVAPAGDAYLVSWLDTGAGTDTVCMGSMTSDFITFSAARPVPRSVRRNMRRAIPAVAAGASGTVERISRAELRSLIDHADAEAARHARYSENAASDAVRFAGMAPVRATLRLTGDAGHRISPMLMGIFFEDISRAADGGLYAELVQNRDFEYDETDLARRDPSWNHQHSWSAHGDMDFAIDTVAPLHPNNPHYAAIEARGAGAAVRNTGFAGIAVRKGEKYDLSVHMRAHQGPRRVRASLLAPDGTRIADAALTAPHGRWGKDTATFVPSATCDSAVLAIEPAQGARLDMDMVSLFPRATFHGRRNGLRSDLADTIAALRPRFVRFPGGCVAHGDGIGNIYRWKNTIGPLESRVPQRNLWGYHQTAGLGYHEYFEFCEDLGAEPLPVVAAGVPCQNSSCGGAGQQGGIPMDEMKAYVQDVLDLIEYANGDARTTEWGRRRAENGHPAPFGLKYLGVGNEDLISDVFKERFKMIYDSVRVHYPDITVVGTAGPFHSGSDYDEGWRFATRLGVPVVDEHYYEAPGWFIYNQDYYDGYDRSRAQVYLGEYASRGNTLYNALAEAAYLCGVERNSDVVAMTSYAPLLAKEGFTNWNPDMIYFTNTTVRPTPNYRVQRLFGENSGEEYVPSALDAVGADAAVRARIAASVVRDAAGDTVVKLVNILPVEVVLSTGLEGAEGTVAVLAGDAAAESVATSVRPLAPGEPGELRLPPYSFTVIRMR